MSKRLQSRKASDVSLADYYDEVNDTDQSETPSEDFKGSDSPDSKPPAKHTKLKVSPKDSRKSAAKKFKGKISASVASMEEDADESPSHSFEESDEIRIFLPHLLFL